MSQPLRTPVPPSQELLKQWLQRQLDLLQAERAQEQHQSRLLLSKTPPKLLEQNGLALLALGVVGIRIGLGAKLMVELERPSAYHASTLFPPHSFRPGDLAEIQDHTVSTLAEHPSKSSASPSKAKNQTIQGVIYKVTDSRIVVAASDRSKRGGGGKSKPAAPLASAGGADDKSDKRDARSGDAAKVSGDELEIPERVRLVKVANEATFDRMERTLARLAKSLGVSVKTSGSARDDDDDDDEAESDNETGDAGSAPTSGNATSLVRTLMGLEQPTFTSPFVDLPLPPFNAQLNASQLQAIRFALSANHFALIHGPPGTGKTTAIVELIMQMVAGNVGAADNGAKGVRILVCGASNLAVDNLLERIVGRPEHRDALKRRGAGVTRLGHPARVLALLQSSTLDAQSSLSSEGQLVNDVASELSSALAALRPPSSTTAGNKSARSQPRLKGAERRQRWEEVRLLRREYRQRERGVTRAILDRAQIVVATCHGAGARQLVGREFDVVIIDEACQALEAVCWIPILKVRQGGKLVLAGDHLQLPPTVKSAKGTEKQKQKQRGADKEGGKGVKPKDGGKRGKKADKASKKKDEEEEEREKEQSGQGEAAGGGSEGGEASESESKTAETFVPPIKDLVSPLSPSDVTTHLRPARSLETTLFSRLLGLFGPGIKTLLSIQYRMNLDIMAYPNAALYEGQLEAHSSCATISLRDVESFRSFPDGEGGDEEEEEVATAPVVFYDTAGCEFYESSENDEAMGKREGEGSKWNENEAALILRHIGILVRCGLEAAQMTVLSPYSAQVSHLSTLLRGKTFLRPDGGHVAGDEIEVGTIDAMQGRENQVVLISLVRSNPLHQVGFLSEKRRLNVAITRAKRQLVVVADSETVGHEEPFLKKWMQWLDEKALVESVVTLDFQ
ncbi:hypothetical protein ACQY0O_007316 [Thecaphora frezii]